MTEPEHQFCEELQELLNRYKNSLSTPQIMRIAQSIFTKTIGFKDNSKLSWNPIKNVETISSSKGYSRCKCIRINTNFQPQYNTDVQHTIVARNKEDGTIYFNNYDRGVDWFGNDYDNARITPTQVIDGAIFNAVIAAVLRGDL